MSPVGKNGSPPRPIPRAVPIPSFWSGSEALSFVAFLELLISQVWAAHGHAMSPLVDRAEQIAVNVSGPNLQTTDDEIPF